jgi:anti-sigma factor RsiW
MSPNRQAAVVEMSCVEVRRLINDYLDGDLELEGYVRVDAHLDECDHCSALYDGVRNVVSLLGSGEVFPLPQGMEGRLIQHLIESQG